MHYKHFVCYGLAEKKNAVTYFTFMSRLFLLSTHQTSIFFNVVVSVRDDGGSNVFYSSRYVLSVLDGSYVQAHLDVPGSADQRRKLFTFQIHFNVKKTSEACLCSGASFLASFARRLT